MKSALIGAAFLAVLVPELCAAAATQINEIAPSAIAQAEDAGSGWALRAPFLPNGY